MTPPTPPTQPPSTQRERILEAAYRRVAQDGMARSTIEDIAKDANVSRPTVYRHFPGGKDALFAEVVAWEAERFVDELTHAIAPHTDPHDILEELLMVGAERIKAHMVLQKVLQTEPERLVPLLLTQSDRIIAAVRAFVEDDYIARMFLSLVASPGSWDLADREQVARLVRTQLLPAARLPAARPGDRK